MIFVYLDESIVMNGSLNKVMLIGNVGSEIKVHQFDNQNKVGNFPLATNESYVSKETGQRVENTEWHNIVIRETKVVEIFEKYVKTGDKLYVEGKIKTRKWQDSNGQNRYITEIILQEFTFLSPKNEGQAFQSSKSIPSAVPQIEKSEENQPPF